jgi:hypothetical protein
MMTDTKYTYCEDSFSDLHKEAYGMRPRESYYEWLQKASPDEKQAEWDLLVAAAARAYQEVKAMEKEATERFEAHVADVIALGAKDRATALRWIMDGSDADGDWDYLCYLKGLPFRYFAKETV